MTIRTDADIRRLREQSDLTDAEEVLIETCRAGERTVLGEDVPDGPSDARTVRADLLRYLITGGCDAAPTQDRGVSLFGAYVTGQLDLAFATAKGATELLACKFENPIHALQTRFEALTLADSHLPGMSAQGAQVAGSVFLHRVETEGHVGLIGARIGGQLACEGAEFRNGDRQALNAQGTGGVFLDKVKAEGEVSLAGAEIAGQLSCTGAEFANTGGHALNAEGVRVPGDMFLNKLIAKGEVTLAGAKIGGQLECRDAQFKNEKGNALNAQQIEAEALLWRGVGEVSGKVNLQGAHLQDLVDDAASWDKVKSLRLNGSCYDRIRGPLNARVRLSWVAKDAEAAGEFRPQPYEQLARVFRAMGHSSDARQVGLEKETLLAADWKRRAIGEQAELRARRDAHYLSPGRNGIQKRLTHIWLDLRIMPLWHGALRYMVGYGHAPQRALLWTLGTIVAMGLFYLWVWIFGGMVPNSAIVLTSSQWASSLAENPDFPALAWIMSGTGQHYETFNAFAYAADVFIPLVDLGQDSAWTATTATAWGSLAWVLSWFLKLFGWIVTAVGAAAITGIIRRE